MTPFISNAASINPQLDESEFRSNTKELTTLFSPLTIGSMEISNRMVKSAAGSATYLAGLTDELLTYYVNLAKGGVALIYVETIAALEVPEGGSYDADTLAFGQKLVDECHKYGAKMGYQMSGFGMGENDMTIDDIHAKQAHFVEVAKGLQQMGFDCVELNCAGFNMPAHFLSRFHNTRTDEYGIGSIENRARFITEIIEGVKKECGPDFNMQILINCIEENDNISNNPTMMTLDSAVTTPHTVAMTMEEGIAAAKLFEQAGCDSMHLRLGPLGHHVAQFGADLYFILNGIEGCTGFGTQYDFSKNWQGMLIGNTSGCGIGLNVAAEYKKALSIPCGVVTYNDPAHAPDFFEQALEDGKADFFLMTRPLTVDMEYVNKLKEGRIDEIAPCTRCLHCHIGSNEANAQMAYCRVNALTQRVMREGGPATYELEPAATPKKVMVIGENLQIRRFVRFAENTSVGYVHAGGKIGVLVNLAVEGGIDATTIGKDVAMQIAALNPRFWDKSLVTEDVIAEEKKVLVAQMDNDPKMATKPQQVKEKIAAGKLNKFYEENCLLQQAFVKDGSMSVEQYMDSAAKALGGKVTFVDAVRFEKGEGIEKKQEDFAAEVAAQMNAGH